MSLSEQSKLELALLLSDRPPPPDISTGVHNFFTAVEVYHLDHGIMRGEYGYGSIWQWAGEYGIPVDPLYKLFVNIFKLSTATAAKR